MYSVLTDWRIRKSLTMSSIFKHEKSGGYLSQSEVVLPFYIAVIDLDNLWTFRFDDPDNGPINYDKSDYDGSDEEED